MPVIVTRSEIHSHVIAAFESRPVTRDDLLAAARASGGRAVVLEALQSIDPDEQFQDVRDIWIYFPDMPLES